MTESPEPESGNESSEPATEPSEPAETESPLPLPEIPAPTLEEPAAPAAEMPAPLMDDSTNADQPRQDEPVAMVAPEPVRRWIDDSGTYGAVGRLVEVHPDRVRILKLNGRYTTVPISRLSAADKSYVTTQGERLAAKPGLTDTAGM